MIIQTFQSPFNYYTNLIVTQTSVLFSVWRVANLEEFMMADCRRECPYPWARLF